MDRNPITEAMRSGKYCWTHMSECCKGRYYCPRCGYVQCGRLLLGELQVQAHERVYEGEKMVRCPGGPVHVEKDKAP